jgi:hypothetical protein
MVGCDFHQELSPTVPPVPVPMPHFVMALLGNLPGALMGTVKRSDNSEGKNPVLIEFVRVPIILQGSDIGPVIPHIPCTPFIPSPLTLLNTMFSGSTSEFFAFSVKVHGKPVAIAFPEVYFAINLNCGFPCSAPLDAIIAPATVFTGFRWGDLVAGIAGMFVDALLSLAINTAFNGWGLKGTGGLLGSSGLLASRITNSAVRSVVTSPFLQAFIGSFGLLGSPMGYSNASTTVLGAFYGDLKSAGTQGIADYFNPPPGGNIN